MKYDLFVVLLLIVCNGYSQSQTCPLNIDWSQGTLTHWFAYTGNNALPVGNGPGAIKQTYNSIQQAPAGTIGVTSIYEYEPGITPQNDSIGIEVIRTNFLDNLGFFSAIPAIGGYQYSTSIRIGSQIIDHAEQTGGYVRGVGMTFDVPAGASTVPFSLTYAYAMGMSNGYHPNNQQPLFSVTLMEGDSVVTCASPVHYLPTTPSGDLDTASARLQGFYRVVGPPMGGGAEVGTTFWAKGWTEVSIDLAPYRGQQVSLIFETDNCVPGGHYAYSYIAIRGNCAMGVAAPVISGNSVVCSNVPVEYSVPSLEGAVYQWSIPPGWTELLAGGDTTIEVLTGNTSGTILLNTQYGCANLHSSLHVVAMPPTIAGSVTGGTEVCTGVNAVTLTSGGNQGNILSWLAMTDGLNYTTLGDTTAQYTARNLDTTTTYRALIQNGPACSIDTTSGTTVFVDPMSAGGKLSPIGLQYCQGQNVDATLTLSGQTGKVVDWETSADGDHWAGVSPVDTATIFVINNLTASVFYRVLVQDGVCPSDTSPSVEVEYINISYPQVSIAPADTLICYGSTAPLHAVIETGTNYEWTNAGTLQDPGNGTVTTIPDLLQPVASPKQTTDYVLTVDNSGCPNVLRDTFVVAVHAPIQVNPGDDTSVVVGQPLQLSAGAIDTEIMAGGYGFSWTPATWLSNPSIANPVGIYSMADSIRYLVTATAPDGCMGSASLLVKVYGTAAGIFVPAGFTPGGRTNNTLRPIAIGIASLTYFRVYNRWGQLVYETRTLGAGWDGRIDGQLAEAGAYVWMVQGKTYSGQVITHQGTMILIR